MKIISDDTTSSDNRDALKDFFTKFPQYLANGLYVSGESYAGIYVPTLIAKIVDDDMLSAHFKVGFNHRPNDLFCRELPSEMVSTPGRRTSSRLSTLPSIMV